MKYLYITIGLIVGLFVGAVSTCFTYPTAEEMNIQMQKLYNNVGNLIHKRITPIYQLVDGQLIETGWQETIENLQELNSILAEEIYVK